MRAVPPAFVSPHQYAVLLLFLLVLALGLLVGVVVTIASRAQTDPPRVRLPRAEARIPPADGGGTRAPDGIRVSASGADRVRLTGPGGDHLLPATVQPGRYAVAADFGQGFQDAGRLTVTPGADLSLVCDPDRQACHEPDGGATPPP